jgi:hypothetical protein
VKANGIDGHRVALLRAFLIRTYAPGMLMRSAAASISLATRW